MHDVGMNMSQLAMSVKQVDDTIELAHEWSHQLLHATENFGMERIGAKLEAAMAALHEAHDALAGVVCQLSYGASEASGATMTPSSRR